jgi:23S rRNA pseudouridine2605 synthase
MKRKTQQKPSSEPSELVRINRFLSMCGVASRRKADDLVLEGKVTVNGKEMTDVGSKINPRKDKVFVNGKQITQVYDYLYLVMNKPKDAITTLSDEKGRTTVMSLVKTKQRVYPIGRLDRNTTGILLLTNDGEFANAMMHPKFEVSKSYQVTLETAIKAEHAAQLRKGVKLEDGKSAPAEVYILPTGKGKEIGIIIHEGRNRQVRRMFESLGYEVKKLDRVAYGPITKDGLSRGETRSLTRPEVRELKKLAGVADVLD